MISILSVRFRKHIALFLYCIFYLQLVGIAETLPLRYPPHHIGKVAAHPEIVNPQIEPEKKVVSETRFGGGPTQPEMQSFQSVNNNNMVDLFTGDFSYNIPLMDVGGYPVNIAYHGGRSMDEEASWVGFGWNINPGSITRDMRGVPDDFNGKTDTITKVSRIKDNYNWGLTIGADVELTGLPLTVGASLGIFHTTYNGWGVENSVNASINSGAKASGPLSGGLSITNNSQNGITITPSLSVKAMVEDSKNNLGGSFGLGLQAPYNSRTGLKDIHLGLNTSLTKKASKTYSDPNKTGTGRGEVGISFAWPTYTPTISMPMTNYNFSFTAKTGTLAWVLHPSLYLSGYFGREFVAEADISRSLPAYGYLNMQNRSGNWAALTDFNREKEVPYREKPPVPHIAMPSYTYDVFTISGEGTGGMFRAYRGDVGFIADPLTSNKTYTGAASLDFGAGNLVHGGTDLNANYSTTQSGPWLENNPLKENVNFTSSAGLFQSAYFRNPSEKSINTTDFYDAIGGDHVAVAALSQDGSSIMTTNTLNLFDHQKAAGSIPIQNKSTALRQNRDKRAQVISYLTAEEASIAGMNKYIDHYAVNQFGHDCGDSTPADPTGKGTGLTGYYYPNKQLSGTPSHIQNDTTLSFNWGKGSPFWHDDEGIRVVTDQNFPNHEFSIRWLGRVKAPASGTYTFGVWLDDGYRLWLNDSLLIDDWHIHGEKWDTARVNLVAGQVYNIRAEYFQNEGKAYAKLGWKRPDHYIPNFDRDHHDTIKREFLYPLRSYDTIPINPVKTSEYRVNNFRKASHISQIDVLNPDGRKYVYGIPVYNLLQRESSFTVDRGEGNPQTGMTGYTAQENSTGNSSGKTGTYSREEIPAYAHSFLLTGILSPDYVDVTGDGISDDDIGDAVKFDYSKTSGIANPFEWRAPYVADSASYSPAFRSYNREDKGHYIYGQKELWYLHTIESKTMIATFTLQPRADLLEANEQGHKLNNGKGMCLKQIDLYSKADFLKNYGTATPPVPVKTVHFEYSYELCRGINQPANDSGKLTLKRIWFTYNGNNKGILNPYEFHYHANNPRYQVNMSDKWGTYKDPSQNPNSTTSSVVPNSEYPYALQDSTLAAYNAGAWSLDSIRLPSGGRIKVNYESDDYAYVQNRRATQMLNIVGIGTSASGQYGNRMYNLLGDDGLYVYIKTPTPVTSKQELYARYLDGLTKIYFRLYVGMPSDEWGSGSEYVPCYADPDLQSGNWYGILNSNTIWVRVKGVNKTGNGDGPYSPLAQTAVHYLRLNLPSKAYPGSEMNDNLSPTDGIKILLTMITNVTGMINGFDNTARGNGWACNIDPNRSYIRLNCPSMKKYGGGQRVKSILIYDNWNAMTKGAKKETVHGQVYDYTTTQSINGVPTKVSSGVAVWEPTIGGEENPFHLPIEWVEKASIMAPAALQYTEEPLGETFYPGPSVGYSKVRVRSIHTTGTRSANGYAETTFYTSYDFPTTWDYSMLDNDSKKRYKPLLQNFLRINAKNYLTLSQGFKVELNDMNGKTRTEATYSETDSQHPLTYTENFYKVDNGQVQFKHLNNVVSTIDPQGNINPNATIGKDVELMSDMRDQTTNSTGGNINLNVDLFIAGLWPIAIPSLLNLYQHETTQFRSVALMKVIQRYGILDSVVHIDKGSRISSKNLLYDAETGEALLVRTQNEFNDSVFEFNYPAHWVYDGSGSAYRNIDAVFYHLQVSGGKIVGGLTIPDSTCFTSGDEILAYSKVTINQTSCDPAQNLNASFPVSTRLWVIDTSVYHGGGRSLYLIDQYGVPFAGNDVTLKVIRSGRRNMGGSVGSFTSLRNPLVADGKGGYNLVIDSSSKVVSTSAVEWQQIWKVGDKRLSDVQNSCIYTSQDSALAAAEASSCLRPFFNYLIASHQLFPYIFNHKTIGALVNEANSQGAGINMNACPILSNNAGNTFWPMTYNGYTSVYTARIGNVLVNLRSQSGGPMNLYNLVSQGVDSLGRVTYKDPTIVAPPPDTVTTKIYPDLTANLLSTIGSACPVNTDRLLQVDTLSDHLMIENSLNTGGYDRNGVSILQFNRLERNLPPGAQILSARLLLQADTRGHIPGSITNANSVNPSDSIGISLAGPSGWFPSQPLDTMLYQAYYSNWFKGVRNATPNQNDTIDLTDYLNGYVNGSISSSTFIITQGWAGLHSPTYDSAMVAQRAIPPYLYNGYSNNYTTFYSQHYSDPSKWPAIQVTYVKPPPPLDTMGAVLEYNSTISCSTVYGRSCYSAVTDTLVNPYRFAILGNYRPLRSYVYYGRRKESDPSVPANIRTAGVIDNYAPFWQLRSGQWLPSYDTTRWVWNSESTIFSRKGFELENKDPLGRYNAGLYGYAQTMPTAVVQNSRYQESAFEGFEDYSVSSSTCNQACAEKRPFDFSAYQSYISTAHPHTGLYSLQIPAGSQVGVVGVNISANGDMGGPQLRDSLSPDNCLGTRLNGMRASGSTIIPPFTPLAGKRSLVSAWVREEAPCTCQTYTNNHILISLFLPGGDTVSVVLNPSGNMIEGWQRYESVVNIPAGAVGMTISLQASNTSITYFDDIRIHPFNAEMKSYVYNPVNLRMMAELDGNNYATFYEYDDDGTLVRVKKETEKGIQTIKETRSALLKDQ